MFSPDVSKTLAEQHRKDLVTAATSSRVDRPSRRGPVPTERRGRAVLASMRQRLVSALGLYERGWTWLSAGEDDPFSGIDGASASPWFDSFS